MARNIDGVQATLVAALILGLVIALAMEKSRRAWRCIVCGRAGGPMAKGTVDEPVCVFCVREGRM